ncbi:MAG: DUF4860 domain-containing protein [Desulfosporosinus sp.]|nr:DUF4860 domain-containing protein [Desulfosporosinus sp.]
MKIKNTKGFTIVELLVAMAIFAILGTMLLTMMNTGANLYRNANATMDAQSNARIAMSYITVKIRQNDVLNQIYIDNTSYPPLKVLTINDAANPGNTFWIYIDNGKLREQYGNTVTGFDDVNLGSGEEIADIKSFTTYSVDSSENPIVDNTPGPKIHFEINSTDGSVDLKQDITLRSQ